MTVGCQMRHFQLTPLLGFDILQELYFLHQQYFFRLPVTFYNVISFTPSGFWSCKSIMCPKPLWNSILIFKPPDLTRYFTNSWCHVKSYKRFKKALMESCRDPGSEFLRHSARLLRNPCCFVSALYWTEN